MICTAATSGGGSAEATEEKKLASSSINIAVTFFDHSICLA